MTANLKDSNVLANLGYFTEWGGRPWKDLTRHALVTLGDLQGKTVLEIGPRFGKMSCCFALLGANVVGLDVDAEALKIAEKEAKRWNVTSNVSFFHYNGNIDQCAAVNLLQFDVIFTKSVLVKMGEFLLNSFEQVDRRLKHDGRCVFIENREGGAIFSALRRVRPSSRHSYKIVTYLKGSHLAVMNSVFDVKETRKTFLPPILLVIAQKKRAST